MRIGLFGGMFDPVHLGHLHAAEKAAEKAGLDRVIFIPASIPPHKENGCHVSGNHRLAMLRLALEDSRFTVSDYELCQEGTSYSYLTVEHFKALFPKDDLYFLIGDEAYALLHTWKRPERIRKIAQFIVVTREGITPPEDAIYVEIPKVEISSTMVRNRLLEGDMAADLLPLKVKEYIYENGLYKAGGKT